MRNFYRNPKDGEVHEYPDADVSAGFVKPDLVKMTEAEIAAHLAPPKATREQVEIARLRAYSDPITGSDRFIAEAVAERLRGNTVKAGAADAAMLARREEIATQNPWPED